jgi:hypothetical protein
MMKLYPTVPHPFVLEPPLGLISEVTPGQTITLRLLLLGRAIEYLPHFAYAMKLMGENGLGPKRSRFRLSAVDEIQWPTGSSRPLFRDGENRMGTPGSPVTWQDIRQIDEANSIDFLRLELVTPVRIKFAGEFVKQLDLHHLVRNLLRRISALCYFHCNGENGLDYRGMITRSQNVLTHERHLAWVDQERYSSRQQETMKMGGVVGRLELAGELTEFMPLLRLGELVHVGKGTSFGLGKFRII